MHNEVLVISLGGTISMRQSSGALQPALGAHEIVDGWGHEGHDAALRFETVATIPGASLTDRTLVQCMQHARQAVGEGAAGVVVATGTDTLEQCAYLFDLFWDLQAPLVVTGAMRGSDDPGADGPGNLRDAVLVARAAESRERGVLVVMNDEIHAAAEVSKTHTLATDAFRSVNCGPIGRLVESRPVFFCDYRRVPPSQGFTAGLASLERPAVALVECVMGTDGAWIERLAGGVDGMVLCGFGVGHVPAAWIPHLRALCGKMPVVYASGVAAGPVVTSMYGFEGSERSLVGLGAIPAGFLSPRKAQVLLSLLLALGLDESGVRREFGLRGRLASPGGIHAGRMPQREC
jgi:L-asparaginase